MTTGLEDIGATISAAFPTADADALRGVFHPDAVIWHNHDRVEKSLDQVIADVSGAVTLMTSLKYANIRRSYFEDGFVQQHTLEGDLRNGVHFEVEMCIVVRAADGRIVRMDEYLDAGALSPVAEAADAQR